MRALERACSAGRAFGEGHRGAGLMSEWAKRRVSGVRLIAAGGLVVRSLACRPGVWPAGAWRAASLLPGLPVVAIKGRSLLPAGPPPGLRGCCSGPAPIWFPRRGRLIVRWAAPANGGGFRRLGSRPGASSSVEPGLTPCCRQAATLARR